MKSLASVIVLFFCCSAAHAQPVWSADVRAKREMQWMKDSLHLTKDQAAKAGNIVLTYQQQIDKSGENPQASEQVQAHLMHQKDAGMKAILTKAQYHKYYNRELTARQRQKTIYKDGRQPF